LEARFDEQSLGAAFGDGGGQGGEGGDVGHLVERPQDGGVRATPVDVGADVVQQGDNQRGVLGLGGGGAQM
jgi:hypothetical protein